jgi:murein DD-endopeptidase MepM/ murein hydrolase activator NlpD
LQHSGGVTSVYKHGSSLLKQQGDYVLKGDVLGTVADTGVLSSGSHLHLEIWKNGIPQNPVMYLNN